MLDADSPVRAIGGSILAAPCEGDEIDSLFSVQTARLNTTEDLREAVRGADLKIVQLAPGAFDGKLTHARIGTLSLSAGDFEPDIRARGVMNPHLVTIGMMVESDGEVKQWDYDVIPGDIVVFPRGVEQEGRFSGRSRYVTLTLSEENLALHAAGERKLEDPRYWTRICRFRPVAPVREFIRQEVAARVFQLRAGLVPSSPAATAYLGRFLIEAFITGIVDQQSTGNGCQRSSSKIVRIVEDHMDTLEGDGPVHISELCLALNLSRRTLHRAFHDALGVGPAEYLRLRRLAQVHRMLTSGEADRKFNVTQAALEAGFSDLGRFANYYRRLYQEPPSQTFQKFQRGGI